MADLEKEYYNKWMEQVNENRKLRQELEKHKKIDERVKELEWQTVRYKKYFEPLAIQYKEVYDFSQILVSYMEKLVELYNNYILLNPNFNVRLKDEDKNKIIKELQLILLEFLKLKIPKEYDILREITINPKIPKPTKKKFERKKFVIKRTENG